MKWQISRSVWWWLRIWTKVAGLYFPERWLRICPLSRSDLLAEYFHICPLFVLGSDQGKAIKPLSSARHIFSLKILKRQFFSFVDKILTTSAVCGFTCLCQVSLINDYWFCIAEGTTTCPCDEFGREDITNHCWILRVIAVELLNCYFHVFGDYWFNTRKGGHMSVWRMRTWDRDITGHYQTSVVMAVTTGK